MGILLDSSVLIAAERGALDLGGILASFPDDSLALSAITASELLHGVHRAKTPAQRTRREAFVESQLARFPVVAFDLPMARLHARLSAELAQKGTPVGAHDLLIGATALSVGYKVATRDARSFPRIAGLEVVLWT